MNNFRGHILFPSAASVGRERYQDEWDRYPQYSKYPSPPLHNRSTTGASSAQDRPGCSFQNCHNEEEEDETDPDGQPYESDEEDPELARKRKELQEIQEQIMLKRASLGLKTIDYETVIPGLYSEKVRPIKSNETLQERVKLILMQRNHVIRSESPVAKTRRNSINIQHDHPLKHRVKVALEQRFVLHPPVETQHFEEVPFFSAPPPSQIDSSPAEEGEKSNQGFMRFLDILNKGVDIDKLKEMVNDDTDYITQQLHKSQNGGEMHGETSTFSSLPEKKKQRKEEQPLPNPDEQQKHLQNILDSLGLSLGTDEISKLAVRTQERLYGKRQRTEKEDKKEDEPQQTEGEEKYSPAHYTRSSSSSSTSSSPPSPVSKTPSKQSPVGRQRSRSSSHKHRSRSSSHRRRSQSYSHKHRNRSSSRRRRSQSSSHKHRSRSSSRRRRSQNSSHKHRSRSSSRRRRSQSSSHKHRSRSSSRRGRSQSSSHKHGSQSSSRRRRSQSSSHKHRSRSSSRRRRSSSRRRRSSSRRRRSSSRRRRSSSRRRRRSVSPSNSPHHHRRSSSPYRRGNSNHTDGLLQFQAPSQSYPYPPSQYFSPHFPTQMYPNPYSEYAAYYNYWAYNHQSIPHLLPHQQIEPHNSKSSILGPSPKDNESISNESISENDNLSDTSNTVQQTTHCVFTIDRICLSESRKYMSRKGCSKAVGAQMAQPIDPNVKKAQAPGTSGAPGFRGAVKKKKLNKRAFRALYKLKLTQSRLKRVDLVPLEETEPKKEEEEKEKPMLTEEEIKANLKLKLEAFNSRIKKNPTQPAQPQDMKVEDEI